MSKVTISTALTEENIKEAVVDWALKNIVVFKDSEIEVDLTVATRTTGYGMAEHDEHFVEAIVRVRKEV